MAQRWIATDFGGPDVLHLTDVDVPDPGPGQVTVEVRACGMNPADYKGFAAGPANDPATLPRPVGFEVAGVVSAVGPDTVIGSGPVEVGDEVLAFRVSGGYATALTLPAADVFQKPPAVGWAAAANLLLAGATAAEMLHVTGVGSGDTVLVHGASGAVGVSLLQQAALLGARVVGTAGEDNFDLVRRFGGTPVRYGDGLEDRLRQLAPDGYAAALDCVGTQQAIDTSVALVAGKERIVSIAGMDRAERAGVRRIGGVMPESAAYRAENRGRLVDLAGAGQLVVPIAELFPFTQAREALELLQTGHPGGKLALIP